MRTRISITAIFLLLCIFAGKADAQPNFVTKERYLFAVTERLLDSAIQYLIQNDFVALQKLMDTGLVAFLKPGIRVHVTKIYWRGKAQIRLPGSTISLWVTNDAIEAVTAEERK